MMLSFALSDSLAQFAFGITVLFTARAMPFCKGIPACCTASLSVQVSGISNGSLFILTSIVPGAKASGGR